MSAGRGGQTPTTNGPEAFVEATREASFHEGDDERSERPSRNPLDSGGGSECGGRGLDSQPVNGDYPSGAAARSRARSRVGSLVARRRSDSPASGIAHPGWVTPDGCRSSRRVDRVASRRPAIQCPGAWKVDHGSTRRPRQTRTDEARPAAPRPDRPEPPQLQLKPQRRRGGAEGKRPGLDSGHDTSCAHRGLSVTKARGHWPRRGRFPWIRIWKSQKLRDVRLQLSSALRYSRRETFRIRGPPRRAGGCEPEVNRDPRRGKKTRGRAEKSPAPNRRCPSRGAESLSPDGNFMRGGGVGVGGAAAGTDGAGRRFPAGRSRSAGRIRLRHRQRARLSSPRVNIFCLVEAAAGGQRGKKRRREGRGERGASPPLTLLQRTLKSGGKHGGTRKRRARRNQGNQGERGNRAAGRGGY
ncbi:hypothetical protein MARPO_0058s0046 [Marchantia polymorpha]|uniref:Uncharacterized protein n=1 Tax=Marchantia polymorpha TaxID=3197 RepID=A0A2R6WTR3_MARPO|nr:hypothetical protein MARPO_0058s0046 [Marchantia polymorpha]|eukprot:PTQ37258.1 hypothetical protein MARPO_0058s0046 [Marchantia polymorpha]